MKKIIYTILLFTIFTSCKNELEIKNYNWEQKVVMNAIFDNLSPINKVYLFKTGIYNTEKIKKGSVELYINENLAETAYFKGDSYQFTSRFNPKDKLALIAKDSLNTVIAKYETVVTGSPKIDSITIDSTYFTDEYDGFSKEVYQVDLTMKDIPQEDNKFRISVEQKDLVQSYRRDSIYYRTSSSIIIGRDLILGEGYGKNDNGSSIITDYIVNYNGIFSDTHFKNEQVTLTFYIPMQYHYYEDYNDEFIGRDITIKLHTITDDEFIYMHALNIYKSDVFTNGLFDPIIYPSNVKIGTGFIGISSADEKKFYFEPVKVDTNAIFTEN